eukprot:CAMPEP_0198516782 /NCGR_PEP_ID=MMETSP1462-20131121/18124_1 /TAXON_ID=1333877 /ORGANISM="Brandtodinium nutriculum, Strain RCC3387" /LENGTH=116 /DNA_ID=CAMNT_0044246317 /DNA_START=1 /DNA_END=349 /DNA_ORIENTATION=+
MGRRIVLSAASVAERLCVGQIFAAALSRSWLLGSPWAGQSAQLACADGPVSAAGLHVREVAQMQSPAVGENQLALVGLRRLKNSAAMQAAWGTLRSAPQAAQAGASWMAEGPAGQQ